MAVEGEYLKQYLNPKHHTATTLLNYNKSAKDQSLSHEEITMKYFQTLDEKDVLALYRIYEMDFKMFGYSFKFGNLTLPL